MPRLARGECETGSLIDVACRRQNAVRPERNLPVAGSMREAHALVHQPGSEAEPAPLRIDQQQTEAGDAGLLVLHQHDATNILAVDLRDPTTLPFGIEVVDEIRNDLRA